jgi:hypothetical protein
MNRQVVKPEDETRYSCFKDKNNGNWYCTFYNFREVYFKWRMDNPNQNEKLVRIEKNDSWKRWRLAYNLGSLFPFFNLPIMRDGKSPYHEQWKSLIDRGECYVGSDD